MSYLLEKFKMKGKVMEICDRYARNIIASLSTVAHTGDYNDLSNKPTIPSLDNYYNKDEVDDIVDNINQLPDITSSDNGKVLEVNNGSPTWVEPQVFSQEQSNWTETDTTSVSYIKNKPNLATVATSGNYNDLSNTPTIPTVNNGTLTIQKNGNNITTFTANQNSNATANINCEDKIEWTSAGNWKNWKDSEGYYHLHYHLTDYNYNFNSQRGSLFYGSNYDYVTLPISFTNILSCNITTGCSSDLVGATIHSFASPRINFWLWSATTGTKTIEINMNIIAK